MPSFSGLVFRFEPVDIGEHCRGACASKLPQPGEDVFFFIRDVLRRRLTKVPETGFQCAAMFRIESAAPGLRRYREQNLKEPFDAPVTIRKEADRIGKMCSPKRRWKRAWLFLPCEMIGVDLDVLGPLPGKIVQRENCRDRTNRNAGPAIDAFRRIDIKLRRFVKVRLVFPGMNTIDRARIHTCCIFCSDARFSDYVCHFNL